MLAIAVKAFIVIFMKNYEKEGMVDMCKALTELIADGKQEGRAVIEKIVEELQ